MRILVVDDSKAMRNVVMRAVKAAGRADLTFEEAGNGVEALRAIRTSPPDLVLTDWNMPEMSGVEFARAVRANDATKAVPILMVTTNAAEGDIVEALKAGVSNYVVKPFTPATIKEKIEAVLKA